MIYANKKGYPSLQNLKESEASELSDVLATRSRKIQLEKKQFKRLDAFKRWKRNENTPFVPSNTNPLVIKDEKHNSVIVAFGSNHEEGIKGARAVEELSEQYQPDRIAVEMDRLGLHYFLVRSAFKFPEKFKFDQLCIYHLNREGKEEKLQVNTELFDRNMKSLEKKRKQILENLHGDEFTMALAEASNRSIDIVLIDREQLLTVRRLSRAFMIDLYEIFTDRSKWEQLNNITDITKALPQIMEGNFMNRRGVREISDRLKVFPLTIRAVVNERDIVMARNLKRLSLLPGTTLAVVGAGHLDGIEKLWRLDQRVLDDLFSIVSEEL